MNTIQSPDKRSASDRLASYSVRKGRAVSDRDAIVDLWHRSGFGAWQEAGANSARYEWFYLGNPQGEAYVYLLMNADEPGPVGSIGTGLRTFYIAGQKISGGVLVDFVVAPSHRWKEPALLLQREARAQNVKTLQLRYGLPDVMAVSVSKKMQAQITFDFPRFVRVVRSADYLGRIFPSWVAKPLSHFIDIVTMTYLRLRDRGDNEASWGEEFDETFDTLWNAVEKKNLNIGVRDRAFLNWRFRDQPGRDYRVFMLRKPLTRELRMYFVCEIGKTSLIVKDYLCIGSEKEFSHGLLMLGRAARTLGTRAVEIQVSANASTRQALARAHFVERSHRPFFATFNEDCPVTPAADWHITQADEDV